MLLGKKKSRRSMADVNIYTAKKLGDMAESLSRLAKSFTGAASAGQGLSKEDGEAAVQMAAAMVCGDCTGCGIYPEAMKEEGYYLYYLLRTFEQNGSIKNDDLPKEFSEGCRRKEAYLGQLNRNLGRATMNLAWKNRFLESRDAVIVQFREMAMILEEFSHQMEEAADITEEKEEAVKRQFRKHHMAIHNMLILEYENHRKEAYLTVRTGNGTCLTSREAAKVLGNAMGNTVWKPAKDSKTIVGRQFSTIRFVEEGMYRMVYGVARAPKEGQAVSGDNYTFSQNPEGQVVMSLSDGMGSGAQAYEESRQVIELTEQLLETGFSARAALKLVNTVLLLTGLEQRPATLDLCCIDLNSGVLEAMKSGAVSTFILGGDGVEILEAAGVPVGILNPIEPVLISKKLWEDNRIIMVSDGVLDALPGEEKELMMKEFIESMEMGAPQEMADDILAFAASFEEGIRDDMTVLAAGIWKKK